VKKLSYVGPVVAAYRVAMEDVVAQTLYAVTTGDEGIRLDDWSVDGEDIEVGIWQ
jgi:hypothetical protein